MVLSPPDIITVPGGAPFTNERFAGKAIKGVETFKNFERENPAVNVLITSGENMWVSCKLATWPRIVVS